MADSVFNSVASATNYHLGWGTWGDVYLNWAFNVRITIYEEPRTVNNETVIGKLECWFPSNGSATARFVAGPDTGDGSGFWNAAGIMWGDGTFTPQFYSLHIPPFGSDSDSYSDMVNQLDAATSDYFVRFAFIDSESDGSFSSWTPTGASFSRNIKLSELDADGNLPQLVLARIFQRWYDNDGAEYDTGYNYGARVTLSDIITSSQMNLDWHYYPWARKLSGAWESCNRDFSTTPSSNRSAYLRHKESGSWQDVLNTLQPSGTGDQMSWRKQGGSWKYALPYGNNA